MLFCMRGLLFVLFLQRIKKTVRDWKLVNLPINSA